MATVTNERCPHDVIDDVCWECSKAKLDRKERYPSIEKFGEALLLSGDLDPLYIALYHGIGDGPLLRRWLLAYWCCYHAGASSYIAEVTGSEFWNRLHVMARNDVNTPLGERWPRGHERRHFRGDKAVHAVESIRTRFLEPEKVCEWFEGGLYPSDNANRVPIPYKRLREKVTTLPQFGPWIAFKVADMLERVLNVPVSFSEADVMMFEQPYKSALQVWESMDGEASAIARSTVTTDDEKVRRVARKLGMFFAGRTAPPKHDRPVNIQEVETILCKWKSHNTGHYPVGIDSIELHHGLSEWAKVSETARRLQHLVP